MDIVRSVQNTDHMSSLSENIRWALDFCDFLSLIRNLSRLDPKVRIFGKHRSSIKNNVS